MAKIVKGSDAKLKADLDEWLKDRPQIIKDLAAKVPPGRLYRLKSGGHRVFPLSYCEDGTLTVAVSGEYNLVMHDRRVFGIKPDDLIECDLPSESESVGTIITEQKDLDAFIEEARPLVLNTETKSAEAQKKYADIAWPYIEKLVRRKMN